MYIVECLVICMTKKWNSQDLHPTLWQMTVLIFIYLHTEPVGVFWVFCFCLRISLPKNPAVNFEIVKFMYTNLNSFEWNNI